MDWRFKLPETPDEGEDEEECEGLKELCDMMVKDAVSREPLACDLEEERWLGRNETIFY